MPRLAYYEKNGSVELEIWAAEYCGLGYHILVESPIGYILFFGPIYNIGTFASINATDLRLSFLEIIYSKCCSRLQFKFNLQGYQRSGGMLTVRWLCEGGSLGHIMSILIVIVMSVAK